MDDGGLTRAPTRPTSRASPGSYGIAPGAASPPSNTGLAITQEHPLRDENYGHRRI